VRALLYHKFCTAFVSTIVHSALLCFHRDVPLLRGARRLYKVLLDSGAVLTKVKVITFAGEGTAT
jgi:hypothetical protein